MLLLPKLLFLKKFTAHNFNLNFLLEKRMEWNFLATCCTHVKRNKWTIVLLINLVFTKQKLHWQLFSISFLKYEIDFFTYHKVWKYQSIKCYIFFIENIFILRIYIFTSVVNSFENSITTSTKSKIVGKILVRFQNSIWLLSKFNVN